MSASGRSLRLHRILDVATRKAVVIAFDHGFMLGPITGLDPPRERLGMFLEGGADAVLLSPGMLRASSELMAGRKTGINCPPRLDKHVARAQIAGL